MPTVMIASNPVDGESWQAHYPHHAGEFLRDYFQGKWPGTARVYADHVSLDRDVTPRSEADIDALESHKLLWVVVYPATGVEVAIGIGVVALAASIAAIRLIPDVKEIKTARERQGTELGGGSPNNTISDRANRARPEQRIPDIYGTVRSIPDVVMAPYSVYDNHREQKIEYYCIGRGEYFVQDPRDGDSLIANLPDAAFHVFGPGSAPTGAGPFTGDILAIGPDIDEPVRNVYEIAAVNGQTLNPVNAKTTYGAAKIPDLNAKVTQQNFFSYYRGMGIQHTSPTLGIIHMPFSRNAAEVTDRLAVGDTLHIFLPTANMPLSSNPTPDLNTLADFSNAPTVSAISPATSSHVPVTISIPTALQTEWAKVPAYISGLSVAGAIPSTFNAVFCEITNRDGWEVGEFFVDFEHPLGSSNHAFICNFVAPNGFYLDDGVTFQPDSCQIEVLITPADELGAPDGATETFTGTLVGAVVTDGQRAVTVVCEPTFSGRALIKARKKTRRRRKHELPDFVEDTLYGGETSFAGRIVDEVKWVSAYYVSEPPNGSFGNVTTVYTKTTQNETVTRLRQRELSMTATRMIRTWNGSTFAGPVAANSDAENVLFEILTDPNLGNRDNSEIDFPGIAAAFESVRDYFDSSVDSDIPTSIDVTFDDLNLSTEEMLQAVANSGFGQIYRQGNLISARADIDTADSVLAFNMRNVLPGSQKITHAFGPPSENDSVEVEYVDIEDNSIQTVKVPLVGTTRSPRQIKVVGIRGKPKALMHAYRGYNRMLHQRQSLEMETTQEAGILLVKDRILCADLTHLDEFQGEVLEVVGNDLRLSQPVPLPFASDYIMFLQHTSGVVEGIPISEPPSPSRFHVTLDAAPSETLNPYAASGVPTIYNIVAVDEAMPFAYQVASVSAQSNMVFNVEAINYSHMYYNGDSLDAWFGSTVSTDLGTFDRVYTVTGGSIGSTTGPDGKAWMDLTTSVSVARTPLTFPVDTLSTSSSYTLACWVVKDGGSGGIQYIADVDGAASTFFGWSGTTYFAGHGGSPQVSAGSFPVDEKHHVCVVYDASADTLRLFLDGVLVDSATSVPAPTSAAGYRYLSGYIGLARDLQRFRRALSDEAVMELFLKTS